VIFLEKENKLKGQNPQTNRAESNNDKKQVMPTVTDSCKQELELAINNANSNAIESAPRATHGIYTGQTHWQRCIA
jgi:hypothetical protein